MLIYYYDENTNEYLYSETADSDPEESKIQNKFIPLVPKFATLIAPPDVSDNQIPVFNGTEWDIKADYRHTHKICTDDFFISDIETIGEIQNGYLITNELAQSIINNPVKYKIENNQIVEKTDEEYAECLSQKQSENENNEIKAQLFNLDLSSIRSIRAILSGNSCQEDKDKLLQAENSAKALRLQLN